ncbi:glycosyltransferase [Actinomyces viscosus]|uniref:Uncharacterized protein conserved in bacteria n=1 Tax=Actinomyces viscosus TaxID=1656 RepID=A0A448PHM5_ACTVI|nr:glycosyltransferase [Actinomyces viscosus]TFH52054.1 glycosyltransferase [Actinomyces viscosus]VEI14402.1 Uncharacterized protein conserved in bacteria [Actinomyces viscosus]
MSAHDPQAANRPAPELRRALWHLRHSGLKGLSEHLRRGRATSWSRPRRWAHGRRDQTTFPQWPLPSPEETGPRHDVTVGVIADEFTALALRYEWRAVALTPAHWCEQLDETPIDLLFVESAWHGNDDAWRFQVIGPQGPSDHLSEMVTAMRGQGIPTVFWNKEDPAHYDEAIATARLFDWVFTTDEAVVERYRRDLGHDRIGVLPFAVQPTIHNPIRLLDDEGMPVPLRDVAFAGTYFAHKYPERREQMDIILGGALDASARLPHGLDIFSRYLDGEDAYQFPEPWDARVRGSLSYPQMLSAYRAYAVFLNVSSVVSSPSMLPRRVLEVLACGTPVVTTATPATDRLLPPGALAKVGDRAQAGHTVRALVANPVLGEYMTYLAQREIWAHHTYSHRVDTVLRAVGMGERARSRPTIAPLVATMRPERVDHVLETLACQQRVTMAPVILTHGFTPSASSRSRARELGLDIDWITAETGTSLGSCYNLMLTRVDADYVAKIDDDDLYGGHYLFESLAAADYARAEVVGKHAHYLHLTGPDLTVLRFADWEHRYTTFVSGPTLVARTDLARAVSFPDTTRGEDTGFLSDCVRSGARIYSASRFGFVQRRGTTFGHTWDISNTEVLATSTISHWGPPHEMEIPTS